MNASDRQLAKCTAYYELQMSMYWKWAPAHDEWVTLWSSWISERQCGGEFLRGVFNFFLVLKAPPSRGVYGETQHRARAATRTDSCCARRWCQEWIARGIPADARAHLIKVATLLDRRGWKLLFVLSQKSERRKREKDTSAFCVVVVKL